MTEPPVTRMVRNRKVQTPDGRVVLVHIFQAGRTYSVMLGGTKVLETEDQNLALEAFAHACEKAPSSGSLAAPSWVSKKKPKKPTVYRGGLPSLGKRHS
jgi:hypothetical protein